MKKNDFPDDENVEFSPIPPVRKSKGGGGGGVRPFSRFGKVLATDTPTNFTIKVGPIRLHSGSRWGWVLNRVEMVGR